MIDLIYPPDYDAPLLPLPTAADKGRRAGGSGEIFPVIRPDGVVIGKADRDYCHSGSHLLHPVVHLHIIDRNGRIYLQKRSHRKKLLPGYWDTAVGGHVIYGEGILEALLRESSEELNLRDFNPIYLTSYQWETERDSEFVNVFATVGSPDLRPDHDEVETGRWWTDSEILKASSDILTPNLIYEYRMMRQKFFSLL